MNALRLDSTMRLNDGLSIPRLGLGVYLTQSPDAIKHAIKVGYRHIDTAQLYKNEKEVGQAIQDCSSSVKREDIWVTTKVRIFNELFNTYANSI